jgi:hypothetical protein
MTFADVVASLHTPRPGCIACIACNAGIARNDRIARIAAIACNDCNNCNDEETSNDGTAYSTPVAGISRQIHVISEHHPKRGTLPLYPVQPVRLSRLSSFPK